MRATILFLLAAASAMAQNNRSFVATFGSDANNCSQGNECRSFARAITQTNAGGEIIALDSGGFGIFTVDKSLTIVAPEGVNAAVTALTGIAIKVNAVGATVVLRGLDVNGLGASDGIAATNFSALLIENCVVNGFSHNGIASSPSSFAETYIQDCVVRSNAENGVEVGGTQIAIVERTALVNNGNIGLVVTAAGGRVTARESVASGGAGDGFSALAGELTLEECVASGNNIGVNVFLGTIRVSNCTITNNNHAGLFNNSGGTLVSRLNNTIAGNSTNVSGTVTPLSGQ